MDGDTSTVWQENFSVYTDNLSVYYIISILISFFSVIFTWYFHKSASLHNINTNTVCGLSEDEDNDKETEESALDQATDFENISRDKIQLRTSKQTAIVQQISASLTEEQLKEEKEAESQQLAAILQLLKEKEETFQVSSMEELEDQMKLYR